MYKKCFRFWGTPSPGPMTGPQFCPMDTPLIPCKVIQDFCYTEPEQVGELGLLCSLQYRECIMLGQSELFLSVRKIFKGSLRLPRPGIIDWRLPSGVSKHARSIVFVSSARASSFKWNHTAANPGRMVSVAGRLTHINASSFMVSRRCFDSLKWTTSSCIDSSFIPFIIAVLPR